MSDISKVQTEAIVLVKTVGGTHAVQELDNVSQAQGRVNAQSDKNEKGTAQFAKNSTASFAKMSQGLGGLVH